MNLQYLRYALEIDRTGSVSQASKNLHIAQPNLSRAIRELETQLGIELFERSGKGMTATTDGACFLQNGEKILRDMDELEQMFRHKTVERTVFSAVVPRAEYIAQAFAEFSTLLPDNTALHMTLREAGPTDALDALSVGETHIGVIRLSARFLHYYDELIRQKHFVSETVAVFSPVLLCGKDSLLSGGTDHPLSGGTDHLRSALLPLAEADPAAEGLCEVVETEQLPPFDHPSRQPLSGNSRILVSDRASAYRLLRVNPSTYLWSVPVSDPSRYGLVQKTPENPAVYHDLLIYPEDTRLSSADRLFIRVLGDVKRAAMGV